MSNCNIVLKVDELSDETLARLKQMSKAMNKRGKESKFPFATITRSKDSDGKVNKMSKGLEQLFGTGNTDKIGELQQFIKDNSLATYKKVAKLFSSTSPESSQSANWVLEQLNNEDNTRTIDELMESVAVMHSVLGALQDRRNMLEDVKSDGVDKSNRQLTLDERKKLNSFNGVADAEQITSVIGKMIVRSRMQKIKGPVSEVHFKYVEIGQKAIDRAVEDGLIVVNDKAMLASAGLLGSDGKYLKGTVGYTDSTHKGKARRGVGIMLNTEDGKFGTKDKVLSEEQENNVGQMYDTLKMLNNLITPISESLPEEEAKDTDSNIDDIVVTETGKEVRQDMQDGEMAVNPHILGIFKALHKIWEKSDDEVSFKNAVMREYGPKFTNADEFMEKVFGINTSIGNDSILREGARGREVTAFGPLITMMEHYNKLFVDSNDEQKSFHHSLFFAGTGRMFVNETVMQYQADSKMQRHMIEAAHKTDYEGEDLEYLLKVVAEESGVSVGVLVGTAKTTPMFKTILRYLKDGNSLNAAVAIVKAGDSLGFKTSKPFEVMKWMSLINDIKDAGIKIEDGKAVGKLSTGLIVESDATASGIQFKLLQNAYHKDTQNALLRMGLGMTQEQLAEYKSGKQLWEVLGKDKNDPMYQGTYIKDSYEFGLEVLGKLQEEYVTKVYEVEKQLLEDGHDTKSEEYAEARAIALADYQEAQRIQELMDITGKSLRDVLKYFIMKVAYGQSDDNNARDFAGEVIDENIEDVDQINKLLELYEVKSPGKIDGKTMSRDEQVEVKEALQTAIVERTGQYVAKHVLKDVYNDKLFKDTSEDMAIVASFFESLEPERNSKGNVVVADTGSMMSPLVKTEVMKKRDMQNNREVTEESVKEDYEYFDQGKKSKYRMGMDKQKEVLIDDPKGTGKKSIVSAKMFNVTSWKVLPTHMKDAAALVLSLKDVYDEIFKQNKDVDRKTIAGQNPVATIHDAEMRSPKYMRIAEKAMRNRIIDTSYYYDEVLEAIKEMEYRLNGAELPPQVQKLKDKYLKKMTEKQKFMSQFKVMKDGKWTGEWMDIPNSFGIDVSEVSLEDNTGIDGVPTNIETKPETSKEVKPKVKHASAEDFDVAINQTKLRAKKDSDYLVEVDLKPEELKEISEANKKYLEENRLELVVGTEFEYDPKTGDISVIDKNTMDEAEYEVYLAHEIRHRMTYNWLLDNKDSADVKYLTRAIDKVMKDVFIDTTIEDMNLWRRLEYMKDQKNDIRKTAEIVAILSAEPNIRETFIKHFPQKQQTRLQEIMQILMDVFGIYSNPKYVINMVDNIVAKTDTTKENDVKIHKQELKAEVEEFANKLGISKEMAKTILDISEDCE